MQTILVCDDDKEIVEAIDIYLQQEGYQVLKAYDGEEALEILKEKEVHLLIIDVMMPRLDGYSLARRVRARRVTTPILMLTARADVQDRIVKDPGGEQYPDHYSICENGRCGQDFRT